VRSGVQVRRVLVDRGQAVGVETDDGVIRADEVVLSAGAVGSPHLLLRSGIGPAAGLRAAGIDVVADVGGVGRDATDHPLVYVTWRPARPVPLPPAALPLHGALHTDDLELLPWLAPFGRVMGTDPDDRDLSVGVGLMREDSRGRLRLGPDRAPLIEYRYLTEQSDLRRLRDGVRLAAELLHAPSLAELGARTDPHDSVLDDDAALDGWIRDRLTTAVHLSGTARMGAVVDAELRVRGVAGLRVVDTSVLPTAPSRGPAATAVMLGERAADLIT
jgi:choline dehydrogenase-like flavoprotein